MNHPKFEFELVKLYYGDIYTGYCTKPDPDAEAKSFCRLYGGDRDVGPAQVHGVLVFNQPYGCVNGIICCSCKIEWLRVYLELHDKQ